MRAETVRTWEVLANARADEPASLPEPLRVVCWRLAQLYEAGFTDAEAFVLATDPSVELHAAVDLLRRGCPHETAVEILL